MQARTLPHRFDQFFGAVEGWQKKGNLSPLESSCWMASDRCTFEVGQMGYHQMLSVVANLAAIFTAVVAAGASFWLWHEQFSKRQKLEKYLQTEKEKRNDKGLRSLMHLMRKLSMTEADIMHAAFRSKHVEPRTKEGSNGFAETLLFEYTGS